MPACLGTALGAAGIGLCTCPLSPESLPIALPFKLTVNWELCDVMAGGCCLLRTAAALAEGAGGGLAGPFCAKAPGLPDPGALTVAAGPGLFGALPLYEEDG